MAKVAASTIVVSLLLLLMSLLLMLSLASSTADAKYSRPDWLQFGSLKPRVVHGSLSPQGPNSR